MAGATVGIGGVTTPHGYRASGSSAGIKAKQGLDLALLVSDTPATAAAVFTTNRAQAAPILVSREHLSASGGVARAIVVNSGCANACTGDEGFRAARDMAAETARLVGCSVAEVLVASTGVIGVALPIEKIRAALPAAFRGLASDQGSAAARAIMTTDPFPKEAAAEVQIGGRAVRIGGMAKGSGMIEPMMATMLGFITTDADVPQPLLARALREAVDDSFNAITVDGECSTNDSVMLLANGAGGASIDELTYRPFVQGLHAVCRELAMGIVRGGEGATKLVTVTVTGAASTVGRPPRGESHRQFAARQDGDSRRRSQLGPAHRGGRTRERRVRAVARGGDDRADDAVPERPALRRSGSRSRRVPSGHGDHRVGRSRRRRGIVDGLDLRPQRGVRADQRGVSNVNQEHRRIARSPCIFSSVVDFDAADLERCLELAIRMKAERSLAAACPDRAAARGPVRGDAVREAVAADADDVRDRRAGAGRAGHRAAA